MPRQMAADLDRQSVRAGMDKSAYARGLLFRALQGEVPHTAWQTARSLKD